MDNPKSLRLWDCAVCNDNVDDRMVMPLPANKVRPPSGLAPLPAGVGYIGGSAFDSTTLDKTTGSMRTPAVSGAATPAGHDPAIFVTSYHYQSPTAQDRGRFDIPVQLRVQRKSAYGDIEELKPLTDEQLHAPAVAQSPAPPVSSPTRMESPGSLYRPSSSSGPQLLLEATQSFASEVLQTLSPRKSEDRDPLVKGRDSQGSNGFFSFLPTYITSLWSSDADQQVSHSGRVEVTRALQNGFSTPAVSSSSLMSPTRGTSYGPSTSVTDSARKNPPTYGGAYAASPYHIPRPNHVDLGDFPSPSRTPYNPATTKRR